MGPIGARLAVLAGLFVLPALLVVGFGIAFLFVTIGLAVVAAVLLLRPSVIEEIV